MRQLAVVLWVPADFTCFLTVLNDLPENGVHFLFPFGGRSFPFAAQIGCDCFRFARSF